MEEIKKTLRSMEGSGYNLLLSIKSDYVHGNFSAEMSSSPGEVCDVYWSA